MPVPVEDSVPVVEPVAPELEEPVEPDVPVLLDVPDESEAPGVGVDELPGRGCVGVLEPLGLDEESVAPLGLVVDEPLAPEP